MIDRSMNILMNITDILLSKPERISFEIVQL